uniref:Rubrerythrin diiron-binding domain-containing protein n=1 Tax=candidate division WOR-3 bacterium TaxID=2052148 RepID=A0A7C4YGD9_UNCW3
MKDKLKILEEAINMEVAGKEYYSECAKKIKNILGKKIFEKLVEYEDNHIVKIKEVYQKISNDEKIDTIILSEKHLDSKNIFKDELKMIDKNIIPDASDLDALKEGMRLEDKSETYYTKLAKETDDPFEKRFYLALAFEEKEHYMLLFDTYQYLKNPSLWFFEKEGETLDVY